LGAVFLIWLGYELHPTNPLKAPERIVPAAVLLPPDRRLLLNGRERERLELALRRLLRHVDSLAADSAGRRVFDSLVRARPGLLDSARKAERYFSMEELLNH
jgi:hypothetical protein